MAKDNQEMIDILQKRLTDKVKVGAETFGTLEFECEAISNQDAIAVMKEEGYDILVDITGVHYPKQEDRELAVVYHLQNMKTSSRLRMKCYLPISRPNIPTLTGVYMAANWMERETYDFYGIVFDGHPDLRRILNVDEMDYFPMRKEYPLEDQTRTDKDDEMFGRKSLKDY